MRRIERIDRIMCHPLFCKELRSIEQAEADREFCGHTIEHFLDVSRLAYIENLEMGGPFSKEIIYATAFLHDIGRAHQYKEGIPHEEASALLAKVILPECGFDERESSLILDAILFHREEDGQETENLPGLLYRADKGSRNCFACSVRPLCNWEPDKMNLVIQG